MAKKIPEAERRELEQAIQCPECDELCGIYDDGIACLNGHGKLRMFSHLGLHKKIEHHWSIAIGVRGLLRRTFPDQIVHQPGPRKLSSKQDLELARAGTRKLPLVYDIA